MLLTAMKIQEERLQLAVLLQSEHAQWPVRTVDHVTHEPPAPPPNRGGA